MQFSTQGYVKKALALLTIARHVTVLTLFVKRVYLHTLTLLIMMKLIALLLETLLFALL